MHASNGDAVLEAHEFGQHLRTLNDWHMQPPCFFDFRIPSVNRRTGDNDISASEVLRSVAFKHRCAQTRKTVRHQRPLQIRTGNFIAEIQQHLGNPTHADSANSDKMDSLNFGKHKSSSGHGFARIHTDETKTYGQKRLKIRGNPC